MWMASLAYSVATPLFLVESTKIESVLFTHKIVMSEANVKTNRTVRIKWIYHKERSFASNHFIFLKMSSHYKNLF